ncbi:nuclease-related domain-containing protein [Streptomyces anulatus]
MSFLKTCPQALSFMIVAPTQQTDEGDAAMVLRAPKRRSRAGASAEREARRIRAAEIRRQHRTALWALPSTVLVAGVAGYGVGLATSWHAGAVVAVVLAVLALRRVYRNSGSTWAAGAAGERRTRWILAPLSWLGLGRWAVLHDLQIPESRANWDHLAFGPPGATMIDSKEWRVKNASVRTDREGRLWYGRYEQSETLDTVRWEARRATEVLGHPVRPVIAVHHARVPPGGLVLGDVTVIQATELRRILRRLPKQPGWGWLRVRRARRHLLRRAGPAA